MFCVVTTYFYSISVVVLQYALHNLTTLHAKNTALSAVRFIPNVHKLYHYSPLKGVLPSGVATDQGPKASTELTPLEDGK